LGASVASASSGSLVVSASGVAVTAASVALSAGWETEELIIESSLSEENLSKESEIPAKFNSLQILAAVGTTNVTANPATSVAVSPKQTAFLLITLFFLDIA
jgi:hypothetical protein